MINKKNDWMATLFHQPDMTLEDFANNGITPENTGFESREYYKNIPDITNSFTENGEFNEDKFEGFYQSALVMYNEFSNNETIRNIIDSDEFKYDPFDTWASPNSKLKDIQPTIDTKSNTFAESSGINNLRGTVTNSMTNRELAQTNKVFNWETQIWEDYTAEDKGGIFKGLVSPVLVYATWDEDGQHLSNGRMVSHTKGEWKRDNTGKPYTETLGDRDISQKQVVAYGDTLTKEGSKWNAYDFFDSDDLDKSTIGTISKLVFSVAPMLIPGVGSVYGAVSAGIALSQLIPTLMKSVSGIIGIEEGTVLKNAGKISAYSSRFNSSVSDYSQEHMVSFENLGNLIKDVSLQLFQQRVIGEIPKLLAGKESLAVRKMGQRMSLAYMAGTSSQEVYNQFKEAGASDRVAGLGMLASMGAMYKLMSLDYFKDRLFRGTYLDDNPIKEVSKDLAASWSGMFNTLNNANATTSAKAVSSMSSFFTKRFSKLASSSLAQRSLSEATEETMEEFSADAVKAMFKGAEALGISMNDAEKQLDFQFSPRDIAQRYAMSFFGGAIGGPIFDLHGKWQNRLKGISNRTAQSSQEETLQEVAYLLRQGRGEEIRAELLRLKNKGRLGDTNLSGMIYESIDRGTGGSTIKFHPNSAAGESQNDVIYDQLIDYIDRIEDLMAFEGLKISDETLQSIINNSELDPDQITDRLVLDAISRSGISSRVFQDFNTLSTNIIRTSAELNNLLSPKSTESKTDSATEIRDQINSNSFEVQKLQKRLQGYKDQVTEILSGERNSYYFGQALFALDNNVNQNFVNLSEDSYSRALFGRSINDLSDTEREDLQYKWEDYSKLDAKEQTFAAYDLFLSLSEQTRDIFNKANEELSNTANNNIFTGELNYTAIADLEKKISEISFKITELSAQEFPNKEEIDELNNQLQQLRSIQNSYVRNKSLILSSELSQEGEDIINRTIQEITDSSELDSYAQGILDLYNYTAQNKISIDVSDTDLNVLLNNVKKFANDRGETMWDLYINKVDEISETDPDYDYNLIDNPLLSTLIYQLDLDPQIQLKSLIERFESNLGINNEIALSAWEEIKQLLISEDVPSQYSNELLEAMQYKVNNMNVIDYINEYNSIKRQNTTSPIYDLISIIQTNLNGTTTNLLEVLKTEESRFVNSKKLEDYIIENNASVNELTELQNILGMIHSLTEASVNLNGENMNSVLNLRRLKENKEELPNINVYVGITLNAELNKLATRVQYLLELSKLNQNQKLRVQKDIAVNMKQRFFETIVSDEKSLIKDKINTIFDIDIDDIWSNYQFIDEVTIDNYGEYENTIIQFETELYKIIKGKGYTDSDLADKLVSLFSKENLNKHISTKMSKETTNISDFDTLIYLASILSFPSSTFYTKYKQLVPTMDKVPVFAQEYAIKLGYVMQHNKGFFNNLLNNVFDSSIEISDFMKDRSKLYNMLFVPGGTGTGKTRLIARTIKEMSENSSIVTLAPTKKQLLVLNDSIKVDSNLGFNKDEFIVKILGRNLTVNDYYVNNSGHLYLKNTITPLRTPELFESHKNRLLFADEISYFNEAELQLLVKWSNLNNVMLYTFGDLKQSSAKTVVESSTNLFDGGLEDTVMIKTPSLTASLRPNYIGKNDNYNNLNTFLEEVIDKIQENPELSVSDKAGIVRDKFVNLNISLKYFQSQDHFVGEKFVNTSDELLSILSIMQKKSSDIAIITDNPTKYQTIKNVKVIDPNVVAGDEFDYILIDKKWSDNAFTSLTDLYTMSQRSKIGSAILSNNISTTLGAIATIFDNTINSEIKLSDQDIDEFKNWRITNLNKLQNEDIEVEVKQDNAIDPVEDKPNITPTKTIVPKIIAEVSNKPTEIKTTVPTESKESELINNTEEEEIVQSTSNSILPKNEVVETVEPEVSKQVVIPKAEIQETIIPETVKTPSIRDDENGFYGSNSDFFSFVVNDLWNYDREENRNSLYNILKLKNKNVDFDKYSRTIGLIGSYFKFGYDKDPSGIDTITDLLDTLYTGYTVEVSTPILDSLNTASFKIIPYNNGKLGLFVATLNINNNEVEIPMFITSPKFGQYTGNITLVNGPKITKGNDGLSNYQKTLDPYNLFNFYDRHIIMVVKSDDEDNIVSDSTLNFVKNSRGRTYAVFTDDMLVQANDFVEKMNPTLSTDNKVQYMISNEKKITLMGMQNSVKFSELVSMVNDKINTLKTNLSQSLDNTGKSNVFKDQDGIFNQVINHNRSAELMTEIISLSRNNEDLRKSLLNAMFEYLTNPRYDDINRRTERYMKFDVTKYDQNRKQYNITNSYVLSKVSVDTPTGWQNRLKLFVNTGKDIDSTMPALLDLENNSDNIYKIIDWIGDTNNMVDGEIYNSFNLKTYFTSIGREKIMWDVSPNRTIYLLTKSLVNADLLDKYFDNTEKFKNGIYVNDMRAEKPLSNNKYIFPLRDENVVLRTDVNKLIGSIFRLDNNQVDNSDIQEVVEEINEISEILESENIDTDISTASSIEEVNTVLKEESDKVFYPTIDPINKEVKIVSDIDNLIGNVLRKHNVEYDNIGEKFTTNVLNFVPFYVSLNNFDSGVPSIKNEGYYMQKINGSYNLFKFNSIESYRNLYDYIIINKGLINSNLDISNYVMGLLNNIEVSAEEAESYYNVINSNNMFNELDVLINNYLLDRLKNNEC